MSNQEQSRSPSPGQRRHGYRPGIVVFVILAAVAIGVALKSNMREQRTATTAPEQTTPPEETTGEIPEPIVPR
jgi:hypothetical protein